MPQRKGASLKRLVKSYLAWRKCVPCEDAYSSLPPRTLRKTISRAAWAKRDDDKRHCHQRRAPKESLCAAEKALLKEEADLLAARDFAALHDLVKASVGDIRKLGELYIYDTALRIGRTLGKSPEEVYLHRGTRVGARALKLDCSKVSLRKNQLPPELRGVAPEVVEDFLCVCKKPLRRVRKVRKAQPI
jgi:hypothetical protein